MAEPWLHIVGIGEDGMDGLLPATRAVVEAAEVIVGGEEETLAIVPAVVASGDSATSTDVSIHRAGVTWLRVRFEGPGAALAESRVF